MALPVAVRAMLVPGAAGALAGQAAVAALLWGDVAHLRSLIAASSAPFVPLLVLCVSFAVTFGGASIAASVIGMGEE